MRIDRERKNGYFMRKDKLVKRILAGIENFRINSPRCEVFGFAIFDRMPLLIMYKFLGYKVPAQPDTIYNIRVVSLTGGKNMSAVIIKTYCTRNIQIQAFSQGGRIQNITIEKYSLFTVQKILFDKNKTIHLIVHQIRKINASIAVHSEIERESIQHDPLFKPHIAVKKSQTTVAHIGNYCTASAICNACRPLKADRKYTARQLARIYVDPTISVIDTG